MTQSSDTKRLADATAALASTILEIINERIKATAPKPEAPIQPIPTPKATDPWLTKAQAAQHFQVSMRTLSTWLQRRYLPHYKIGRIVRIRLSDVENQLNARLRIQRSW